jgi:hypothetical protein
VIESGFKSKSEKIMAKIAFLHFVLSFIFCTIFLLLSLSQVIFENVRKFLWQEI